MEIRFNKLQLLNVKKTLSPKKYQRAAINAINATATTVRKLSYKEAALEYNIKPVRLKKNPKGKPTSFIQRAKRGKPSARIVFRGGAGPKSGDRPGLANFAIGHKRNKKKGGSPKIQVRRAGPIETVERGFYGIGRLKGQGIFQRQAIGRKIIRRTGPSTKQMVEDNKVYSQIEKKGVKILHDKITEKVTAQLNKR